MYYGFAIAELCGLAQHLSSISEEVSLEAYGYAEVVMLIEALASR
jgi:hypothetical protein